MARTNRPVGGAQTHEGGAAQIIGPAAELNRALMCCMLWEDTFYESGVAIADRIAVLVPQIEPTVLRAMAMHARTAQKLRHAPLWVALAMCRAGGKHRAIVADVLDDIVQRPDEITEFLSLYWGGPSRSRGKVKAPLAAQVKKGLGRAFRKFNAYQLGKYKQDDKAIKLRDAMRLVRPRPTDAEQAETWKKFLHGELETPDTWEVALSAGAGAKTAEEKRERWERLLAERKLGALALLRNLRNMVEANVPRPQIEAALAECRTDRVLPFRFLSAARAVPGLEPALEPLMLRCTAELPKLAGHTVLLVDHSGSMIGPKVSAKSELTRFDAACALAILARELCERITILAFSGDAWEIPPRRGFALGDALRTREFGNTYLGKAMVKGMGLKPDRMIAITDEQTADKIPALIGGMKAYMVNVAGYQNGVGYGNGWVHVDGWSEAILQWIAAVEAL
jgi:hypothetical protein